MGRARSCLLLVGAWCTVGRYAAGPLRPAVAVATGGSDAAADGSSAVGRPPPSHHRRIHGRRAADGGSNATAAMPNGDGAAGAVHGPDGDDPALSGLRSFLSNVDSLPQIYGTDLVTAVRAGDATASDPRPASLRPPRDSVAHRLGGPPVITVYDGIANANGRRVPEVLLVAALDRSTEEIDLYGPSAVYEAVRILLECARCESLSPYVDSTTSDEARRCRSDLRDDGITDGTRRWLARLVATRRIVAVPVADLDGYHARLSGELGGVPPEADAGRSSGEDARGTGPECDFPLPIGATDAGGGDPLACLVSYPARVMDDLVRSRSFALGISFHGPGGSGAEQSSLPDEGRIEVPYAASGGDDGAFTDIALAMGAFGTIATKDFGEYSVTSVGDGSQSEGGCVRGNSFSQFAFGAGLSGESSGGDVRMRPCTCSPLDEDDDYCGDHNGADGAYPGPSLRSFVARVVAPRSPARPPSGPLELADLPGFEPPGAPPTVHEAGFLGVDSRLGDGVRMAVVAAELAEPYASVRSVAGVELRDDGAVPLSPRVPGGCRDTRAVEMPESSLLSEVTVTWTVGGGLTVDETAIMHGRWDVLDGRIFDCASQPTKEDLDSFFSVLRDFEAMEGETSRQMEDDVSFTPVQRGPTRWRTRPADGKKGGTAIIPAETTFEVTLDLSDYGAGDVVAIYALARTDQGWRTAGGEGPPPRSNVVNSRTDPEWSSPDGMRGRLDFWSVPVTLTILPQPGFVESPEAVETSVRYSDRGYVPEDVDMFRSVATSLVLAAAVVAVIFCCAFVRDESDGTDVLSVLRERRNIRRQKISVEEFWREESESLELT